MSKVKAHMLSVAIKAGKLKLACKLALLANGEADEGEYVMVYLPNAYDAVKHAVSPAQWAGYLSALAKDGDYKPVDEFFGLVK